jgi:hypothetical protein
MYVIVFRLKKNLPKTLFSGVSFSLFALGDRAYGDAFCAAGRKLAVRLVQLVSSYKRETENANSALIPVTSSKVNNDSIASTYNEVMS